MVGKQLDIPVFQMGQENPVTIAEAAIAHAKKHGNDMVFLDTAGRLHVDEALMEELQAIKQAVQPSEILLVVDAMIGQVASMRLRPLTTHWTLMVWFSPN